MEIFRSIVAVTETPEIVCTKGIGAIILSSSRAVHEFTTETISIWVEKEGKNLDICKDVLVKDLVLLGTFGEDCILSDATYKSISLVDLTDDGGYISLKDGETIKVKLRNLALATYVLNGVEDPIASAEITIYERKSMASEDLQRDFDLKGYDLCSLQKDASITEISLTYDNGSVCKYSPFELDTIAKSVDQGQFVSQSGVYIIGQNDRIIFPTKGMINLNIRKTPGVRLDLTMRIDESDYNLYQMNR